MKTILFDFDGTIADSFEAVLAITNRLALEFGYPPTTPDDVPRLRRLSSREVIRQSRVSPYRLPWLLHRLRWELQQEISSLQPIAGMPEVLKVLKQQGNRLGIVTSNSTDNVVAFLQRQNLRQTFDWVETGLTVFGKGRLIRRVIRDNNLSRDQVIYVGDETRDIEAAKSIGVKVIAVGWGFNSPEILAAYHPNALICHPSELVEVVRL